MPQLITEAKVSELVPALPADSPWLVIFTDAANSILERYAPTVVDSLDEGVRAEALLIVMRAINRVINTKDWVSSQSAGPFSISYVTGGRGLFDANDRAALAELEGGQAAAVPVARFPVPVSYDHLFSRPDRW